MAVSSVKSVSQSHGFLNSDQCSVRDTVSDGDTHFSGLNDSISKKMSQS